MNDNLLRHFIKLDSSIDQLTNKVNSLNKSISPNTELSGLLSSISYISSKITTQLINTNNLLVNNFNKLFNYLLLLMGVMILSSGLSWYVKLLIIGVVGLKYLVIYTIKNILFYIKQSELNKLELLDMTKKLNVIDLGE